MMDHETRARVLKQIVDEAVLRMMAGDVTLPEAELIVQRVRNQARLLLPDKMQTFDLIYQSRLQRVIDQFIRPKHLD
jgi:hypothetical protein